MRRQSESVYRCPKTLSSLKLSEQSSSSDIASGSLVSKDGHHFKINNGIPNFLYPFELQGGDAEFQEKYDRTADSYDEGLNWLFKSFSEDEGTVRSEMIDLIGVEPGLRILEVGCGTGKDSVHIAKRLRRTGELYLLELSEGMLNICRQRLAPEHDSPEFLIANASYLPFPDNYFDAVFHFGGINTFTEKQRSISEFTRVVRTGGVVVFGDEGLPPWLRERDFGKILKNANPLYEHEAPLSLLPECSRNVSIRWILGNAFYVIRFEVGEGAPPLDLDLPIPGKGDSLRSRYELRHAR